MDPLAELELRDAQINQALKKANQKLQRPESPTGKGDEESIDQLLGDFLVFKLFSKDSEA